MDVTHTAFSDESNYNSGPVRSVATITIEERERARVEQVVKEIIQTSGLKELKWKSLRSARDRFAALDVARFILSVAGDGKARIDAMSWRGAIPSDLKTQRAPVASLEVMYYHLFRTVFNRRWPVNSKWAVVADEQTGIDWNRLRELTNLTGWDPHFEYDDTRLTITKRTNWAIESLSTARSEREPLIQVADLFAGLACYSRENSKRYWKWLKGRQQASLSGTSDVSSADRERFVYISEFNSALKGRNVDVALGYDGFITLNPEVPINFWHYVPKAAIKAKQTTLQA